MKLLIAKDRVPCEKGSHVFLCNDDGVGRECPWTPEAVYCGSWCALFQVSSDGQSLFQLCGSNLPHWKIEKS